MNISTKKRIIIILIIASCIYQGWIWFRVLSFQNDPEFQQTMQEKYNPSWCHSDYSCIKKEQERFDLLLVSVGLSIVGTMIAPIFLALYYAELRSKPEQERSK